MMCRIGTFRRLDFGSPNIFRSHLFVLYFFFFFEQQEECLIETGKYDKSLANSTSKLSYGNHRIRTNSPMLIQLSLRNLVDVVLESL